MQVFLNYAEADEALARRVANALTETGLKVWDDRYILPGQNWAEEVARALRESEAMVVLLTPAALRSTQVQRTIEYALGEEAYSHRLIPVIVGPPEKLPEKDIPWILHFFPTYNLPERGRQDKEIRQIAEALMSAAPS